MHVRNRKIVAAKQTLEYNCMQLFDDNISLRTIVHLLDFFGSQARTVQRKHTLFGNRLKSPIDYSRSEVRWKE